MAEIRVATVDDALAIAKVHVNSYRAIYRGLMSDRHLAAFSEQTRAAVFTKFLQDGTDPIDVLKVEDGIAGFCCYGPSRDADKDPAQCCELYAIYLEPSVWHLGHGSAMARRVIDYARANGFSEVNLWVLEGNRRARSFYEAIGFAPDGASKRLEEDGWHANELRYRCAVDLRLADE